jgi:hypothetical protein
MFDFAPGKPGDDKQCIFCHRTVDLVQGSAGSLRKQVDATLCAMCHGQSPPRNGSSGPVKQFYQAGPSPDGPVLYDLACAACHENLENSKKKGARTDQIQRALENDKGEMGPLTVLSTEEIQSIVDALANQDSCPGDVTGDGTVNFEDLATLKANFFQSCSSATCGDLNSDNTVNFEDLAILKANFFNTCP